MLRPQRESAALLLLHCSHLGIEHHRLVLHDSGLLLLLLLLHGCLPLLLLHGLLLHSLLLLVLLHSLLLLQEHLLLLLEHLQVVSG